MIFTTAGYGVTMGSLASTAANYMGGVRPDVVAYALMGGGKKRRGKGRGRSKARKVARRASRSGRRVARRSPRRSARRSPRRSARRSARRSPRRSARRSPRRSARRSPRRSARRSPRRSPTERKTSRRPDVRRRPEVQRLPKGDRQKRLKQRLSERRTRRSIIKDIESGKHEQARKKMKTLSTDPTRQSSMDSFLAGIESGSMPSAKTLRLSDMSDEPKKKKTTKS